MMSELSTIFFQLNAPVAYFETLARETWPHLFKHWIALSSG